MAYLNGVLLNVAKLWLGLLRQRNLILRENVGRDERVEVLFVDGKNGLQDLLQHDVLFGDCPPHGTQPHADPARNNVHRAHNHQTGSWGPQQVEESRGNEEIGEPQKRWNVR